MYLISFHRDKNLLAVVESSFELFFFLFVFFKVTSETCQTIKQFASISDRPTEGGKGVIQLYSGPQEFTS